MHLPSVQRALIAIPSGRHESAGLLWDICTFIRLYWSLCCSIKRGPVPLFHHFFFFFALPLPCLSLPFCHPSPFFFFFLRCVISQPDPAVTFSSAVFFMAFLGLLGLCREGGREWKEQEGCMRKFWTSWTWTHQLCARPYAAPATVYPTPSICNGLWFHHLPSHPSTFLSLYQAPRPNPPLHPSTLPLRPHLAHSFFIPISLPFVIISQLIHLTVSIPSASGSYPQGVGSLALHRPLQTCNAPCAPHLFLSLSLPPLSAVDERCQLEERNGPNYSIGNWKLAN